MSLKEQIRIKYKNIDNKIIDEKIDIVNLHKYLNKINDVYLIYNNIEDKYMKMILNLKELKILSIHECI